MLKNLPKRTDGQSRPKFSTIVDAFKHAVDQRPGAIAIVCDEDNINYLEYGMIANSVADFLLQMNVKKNDRVVICAKLSINVPPIIFGILLVRAQVTLINPRYTSSEIEPLIKITKPSLILCDNSSIAKYENISLLNKKKIIAIETFEDRLPQDGHLSFPSISPKLDDNAIIMFTGGTTGISKGVPHNHRQIMAAMEIIEDRWPTNLGSEVILNIPPIFHITGLYHGCFQPIYGINKLVLVPDFHPKVVLAAIKKYHVTTIMMGVPTAYVALLNYPDFDKINFSEVRYAAGGGAPLSGAVKTEWETRTGVPALEGYGMTEGAPTCNTPFLGNRKNYSAGLPVACTDFRIVDLETGSKELSTGERGEIIVKGPHIANGYINNLKATRDTFRDGWLHTGDIGYIDDDGFVFVVDRLKEMVIVSGFNVFPREIEEVLMSYPQVKETAVIGIADNYRGQALKAFVVFVQGEKATEKELKDYCSHYLVEYKIPSIFKFFKQLPKTPVGKIDKKNLT